MSVSVCVCVFDGTGWLIAGCTRGRTVVNGSRKVQKRVKEEIRNRESESKRGQPKEPTATTPKGDSGEQRKIRRLPKE